MSDIATLALLPLPTDEVDTPYGKARVTVQYPWLITLQLIRRVKINHILVTIEAEMLLLDNTPAYTINVRRCVKDSQGKWKSGGMATPLVVDRAVKAILPLLKAWVDDHQETLAAAQGVFDKNLLITAHNRVVELALKAAEMSRRVNDIERRFEQGNALTEEDRRVLAIHGSEWVLS